MEVINVFYSFIAIALAGIVFISLLPSGLKSRVCVTAVLLNAAISSFIAVRVINGIPVEYIFSGSFFTGTILLHIDALSAWFILLINFTSIMGAVYGMNYMKVYETQKANLSIHWAAYILLHVSLLCICSVRNSLVFLIVWELMTLSSFVLIIFEHSKKETLKAGINFLIQSHIGVLFLTIAFIGVATQTHSYDFSAIKSFMASQPFMPKTILLLFFFAGFALKAGFIPFHTWLPHAHPAAPSHISGVMSGVIVKLGIYGMLRMITCLTTDLLRIGEVFLFLSVITAFYGILNAAVHRDFKRMLAFCTIENIGIIGMGIGIGMIGKGIGNPYIQFIGFAGALLHTLNHSLYKSLLFFAAGNVYQQTHTRNMENLGGLIKKMQGTSFFFLAGALAICGLPPLNGFVSEFLIYSGLIEGIKSNNAQFSSLMILCVAGLALSGGISLLAFTKSFGMIFLGSPRTVLPGQPKEVSGLMLMPLYIIFSLMLLIGIFPKWIMIPLASVVHVFDGSVSTAAAPSFFILADTLSIVGKVSLLLLALTCLIYFIKRRIAVRQLSVIFPTWACGFTSVNTRMQYTGKSFSKSLAKLFSFITTEEKKYRELDTNVIFPEPRAYRSHYLEFFEKTFFDRINNRVIGFFNYFTFIHNGKIQMYVLYGFFFIVALIVATFFNLL